MEQPGGGYVDALFYVLPSVRKICQLVDRSLDLYKPILGKHVEASSSLEHDRSTGLASNPTMIMNDVDQIQGHIEPEMIDGFRVSHNAQIGERIGRQSSWKFGQGNPMFGIPGTAFENSFTWMGNRMAVPADGPPSPNLQLQGKLGQTQLVHSTLKSQTFIVNDLDFQQWRIFMVGNRYAQSIGNFNFKTNFMIQAPGGVGAIFKGQSMVQAEVAAFLGRWKAREFSFGVQGSAPIPAAATWADMGKAPFLTLLSSAISANPYLVIKGHNSIFDQDKSLNSENIIKLAYDRKEQSVTFNVSSTPTTSDANMLHQSIKSPTFLKDVNKNMKEMYFNNWAYTERSGYKVTSTFNIQTLKLNYGLHMMTKWFNKKTSCKMSLESKPGDVLPTVFRAQLTENMMVSSENNPQAVSPMTTELSFQYDASEGKPPKLGLGINFEL